MQVTRDHKFSIIAALIGFLMGHRFSIGRDRRQEFNQAANHFIKAFTEEIALAKIHSKRGFI
jgi:hypothetical protein